MKKILLIAALSFSLICFGQKHQPRTFLFVPGAWDGGWDYAKVDSILTANGDIVYRPTLTGLGERVHLSNASINLSTYIADIVNVIKFENLHNIILVGHSYGGMVISGVAEQVPERIAHLVYLDAMVPDDGESARDVCGDIWDKLMKPNIKDSLVLYPFGATALTPPGDVPQPLNTFTEPVHISNALVKKIPTVFILMTQNGKSNPGTDKMGVDRAKARHWKVYTFEGGHYSMREQPANLVKKLNEVLQLRVTYNMTGKVQQRIKTISEYHKVMGLTAPAHPLISVIDYESIKLPCRAQTSFIFDFYSVTLDRQFKGKRKYGQQSSDFDEGILFFMSPGQVFEIEVENGAVINRSGWLLLIHPDILFNTPLAKIIKHYGYFSYAVHEALFLSDKEEASIITILQNIEQEYQANIDKFSQAVIVAQLELLFTYADRFYQRQFITRKVTNHSTLDRLEDLLQQYYSNDTLTADGLPTVQYVASALNISPNYLSGLLKTLTGQSTQQYIHEKLIEKAKEKLSATDLSVSEIAYELGFEHPQSFSRLFKLKTNLSPLAFRQSLN